MTNGVGLILEGSPESRPMPCDPPLSFGLLTNFQADHLLMSKHNSSFEPNHRAPSPESSYNDLVHNLSVTPPSFRISNSVSHPDLHFNGLDPQGIPVSLVTTSSMITAPSLSDESQNVSFYYWQIEFNFFFFNCNGWKNWFLDIWIKPGIFWGFLI